MLDNKYSIKQYKDLLNSDSPVFIDFYAPWCAPCREMIPLIDSLKVEYHNRIEIIKINTDASKNLIKHLQIIQVPYFELYDKGERISMHTGMLSRNELESVLLPVIQHKKTIGMLKQ